MAAVESKECTVCTDPYNKSSRRKVTCFHCNYESCMNCDIQYLLDSVHEAHCMNCKKSWSLDFLNENFTQSFLKKSYREKREIVYFKEEETHLPALLGIAEQRKKLMMIEEKQEIKRNEIKANDENEDQLVRDQRLTHAHLENDLYQLSREYAQVSKSNGMLRERRVVTMKCLNPSGECKGFLDAKMNCGLCDSVFCKDCHVATRSNGAEAIATHVCKAEDVASIKELHESTKPCPSCHTRIYKTDGCDQMFCVQCHTAFSWRSGQVETGVIHNPHYFEALRAGNIGQERHQPHQGGCGELRPFRQVQMIIDRFSMESLRKSVEEGKGGILTFDRIKLNDELTFFYQQMTHHRAVTLPRFTNVVNRDEERIKYLIGRIEKKKFMQRLYVHKVTTFRQLEEQQIMNTYVTTGEEMFRMMLQSSVLETLDQFRKLTMLTIQALAEIDKKYQHKGMIKSSEVKLF